MNASPAPARPLTGDSCGRLRRLCRIAAADLRLGMWVAELDRPWEDTPFLLRGFLLGSQIELDTVRRHCRHAQVDLDRSVAGLVGEIRQAEARALLAGNGEARARPVPLIVLDAPPARPAGTPRAATPLKARADVHISDATRQRFGDLARAQAAAGHRGSPPLLRRAAGWLRRTLGVARPARAARDLPGLLPSGAAPVAWRALAAFEDELPRARRAFAQAVDTLAALAGDVRAGRAPAFGAVRAAVGAMIETLTVNPDALAWLARVRDDAPAPAHQAVKVALYLVLLGMHLGLPAASLAQLGAIGLLADLGKVRLPQALLDKPGLLGSAEYAIVKEHVQLGLEALAPCALPAEIVEGIAQHHERLDGGGYPRGLRAERIGPWGRMAALADTFAALTTPRPYAAALAPHDALMSLYQWAGASFDEHLVARFVQALGIYPVGSLIELSSGEVAAIVALPRARRTAPHVLVLTAPDKSPLAVPRARDLGGVPRDGRGVRIVRGLAPGAHGLRLRDYHLEGIERELAD